MAKKGAKLAAPPEHLMAREKFTRTLVHTVQRMAVHIWAAEKGIVDENVTDGHEACLEDSDFGIDDLRRCEADDDPYIDAFNDLLAATEPEVNCQRVEDHDISYDIDDGYGDTQHSVPLTGCCAMSEITSMEAQSSQPQTESVQKQLNVRTS